MGARDDATRIIFPVPISSKLYSRLAHSQFDRRFDEIASVSGEASAKALTIESILAVFPCLNDLSGSRRMPREPAYPAFRAAVPWFWASVAVSSFGDPFFTVAADPALLFGGAGVLVLAATAHATSSRELRRLD